MQLHPIVKIDAAAFIALEYGPPTYGLLDEAQTIQRSNRCLDPLDAGSGQGAGLCRAGSEEGRLSTAGMVRCAARVVAGAKRRIAAGRTGKADADPAILDVAADRPAGRRGAGGAPGMQDR